MKRTIVPIILGAFLLISFLAPNMTAETGPGNSDKAVSAIAEKPLQIPIPTTLLLLSTGLIGLIAISRKTRAKSK